MKSDVDSDEEGDEEQPAGQASAAQNAAEQKKQDSKSAGAGGGGGGDPMEIVDDGQQNKKPAQKDPLKVFQEKQRRLQSASVYKPVTHRFVESLYLATHSPMIRAQMYIFERVGQSIGFGHGLLIASVYTNIEARELMYRLPAITMAEVADSIRLPLEGPLLQVAEEFPMFPGLLGSGVLRALVLQLKICLQQMCQYQRMFIYANNRRLDTNMYEYLASESAKMTESCRWMLLTPKMQTHFPERFGMHQLKKDKGMEMPYETNLHAKNINVDEHINMQPPHPLNFSTVPKVDVAAWEVEVGTACKEAHESSFGPAQFFAKYLMSEPNYFIIQMFLRFLKENDLQGATDWLTELAAVRINNTRNIEARGGALTRANRSACNTGGMTDVFWFSLIGPQFFL